MEITKFKGRAFKNATEIKFENRRVKVFDLPDGDFGISFKKLYPKEEEGKATCRQKWLKGKLSITELRISEDAAVALYNALQHRLSLSKTPTP